MTSIFGEKRRWLLYISYTKSNLSYFFGVGAGRRIRIRYKCLYRILEIGLVIASSKAKTIDTPEGSFETKNAASSSSFTWVCTVKQGVWRQYHVKATNL